MTPLLCSFLCSPAVSYVESICLLPWLLDLSTIQWGWVIWLQLLCLLTLMWSASGAGVRGRGEYPPGAFHRQSLLRNPNLAWNLLQKGHNSTSSPLLHTLSAPPLYPLALCCLTSAAERSMGKQEHKRWGKPDAQDLLFPRNAMVSFVFTDIAVSEPLHKTFPALGHSAKEHTGPPRITRYHRRASKPLASSTNCMICSTPGQLVRNVDGVLDSVPT